MKLTSLISPEPRLANHCSTFREVFVDVYKKQSLYVTGMQTRISRVSPSTENSEDLYRNVLIFRCKVLLMVAPTQLTWIKNYLTNLNHNEAKKNTTKNKNTETRTDIVSNFYPNFRNLCKFFITSHMLM